MWYSAGGPVAFQINYEVDGQFVQPTTADVRVFDALGSLVHLEPMPALSTTEPLVIPAGANALAGANLFETRFVHINFVYAGGSYEKSLSYKIKGFTPVTATPAQVRAEIGLDYSELPDADIDVFSAYFLLVADVGTLFSAAFQLGGTRAILANQAVVVRAALDISESLDLRTAVASRAEDHQFSRSTTLDFDQITARLRRKLAALVTSAQGITPVATSIFQLSTPTDVITGA